MVTVANTDEQIRVGPYDYFQLWRSDSGRVDLEIHVRGRGLECAWYVMTKVRRDMLKHVSGHQPTFFQATTTPSITRRIPKLPMEPELLSPMHSSDVQTEGMSGILTITEISAQIEG